MDESAEPVALFKYSPDRKLLLASTSGHGFVVAEKELPAIKRAGRQVLNVIDGHKAMMALPMTGDRIAVLGENKKLLVFAADEIPEMVRGKGVRLLGGKAGEVADITVFNAEEGLVRVDPAGRRHLVEDWRYYEGKRAQAGKLAPRGFSSKSFGGR